MEITDNIPFKYIEEVKKHIPQPFIQNEDRSLDYTWFLRAPQYTTFRVNVGKYKTQEILDIIHHQLKQEAEIRNTEPPSAYIHKVIDDCIVICKWSDKLKNHSYEHQVIIDVTCANAVLRGADIFAPGILSLSSNAKIGDKVKIFADVDRKCKRGFNKPFEGKTVFIGTGTVKVTRNMLFKNNSILRGIGVEVDWNLSAIPRIKLEEDKGLLQNFPSIICGHLFKNITGKVLDMCAAPGNKTTHIATIIGDEGEVIALDKTPEKVARIEKLCERFGLTNVKYFMYDSRRCISEDESKCISYGPPFHKQYFSAVLLDPPCSALGQRPSLMNDITSSQLKSYVSLQRQLFRTAVEALKNGGILVYSTCTITLEENEEMVSWALKKFPELNLKKVEPSLGQPAMQNSSLSKNEGELVSRFGYPIKDSVQEDTIGFFIACFYKKG